MGTSDNQLEIGFRGSQGAVTAAKTTRDWRAFYRVPNDWE